MGPHSRDYAERFKWFWRRDGSGAEHFSSSDCILQIPIESSKPLSWRLYIGLRYRFANLDDAGIRWVVRRHLSPEELGYRIEPLPSVGGHQLGSAIPPSPDDRRYPPVTPGYHQIEVAESDVIADLVRNRLPLPRELADAVRVRPRWDETGPRYRLWFGETLCLEYVRKGGPQFIILRAFQSADWTESIDPPPDDEGHDLTDEQIKNAISNIQKGLNKKRAPIWIEGRSRLRWYLRQIPPS
jgi:hypothetical protein